MNKAHEIAKQVMKNGMIAVALAKYSVDRGADLPLDVAVDMESQLFAETFATQDQTEGMNAFVEKRDSKFTGK